jgi:hypothetical protein
MNQEIMEQENLRAEFVWRLRILEQHLGPDIYAAMPNRDDASVEDLKYIYDMGLLRMKTHIAINEAKSVVFTVYLILESILIKLGHPCGPELMTRELQNLKDAKSLTAVSAILTRIIANIEEVTLKIHTESTNDSELLKQILNICRSDISMSEIPERINHFLGIYQFDINTSEILKRITPLF